MTGEKKLVKEEELTVGSRVGEVNDDEEEEEEGRNKKKERPGFVVLVWTLEQKIDPLKINFGREREKEKR